LFYYSVKVLRCLIYVELGRNWMWKPAKVCHQYCLWCIIQKRDRSINKRLNYNYYGIIRWKTAIVTGAARGIGKAIALKFASEGANIAFTDLVIDENAKNTEKEIEAFGVKAKGYASNAANFEDTANVVGEIVKDFGRVDILVNNAGITRDGLMMRMSLRGTWA